MYSISYSFSKYLSMGDIIVLGGKERTLLYGTRPRVFKLYDSIKNEELFDGKKFSDIYQINDRFLALHSSTLEPDYMIFDCIKRELLSEKKYEYLRRNPNQSINSIWYYLNKKVGVLYENGNELFAPIFEKKQEDSIYNNYQDSEYYNLNNFNSFGISLVNKKDNNSDLYYFINIKGEISIHGYSNVIYPIILEKDGLSYLVVYRSREKKLFCLNTFLEKEYLKNEEAKPKQKTIAAPKVKKTQFPSPLDNNN